MKRNFFKQQNKILNFVSIYILIGFAWIHLADGAMTIQQMEKTMATMRSVCGPKHKLTDDLMDGIKKGQFIESNKDLKCYTLCVAQMGGIVNKRGELDYKKASAQIETMLPVEIKETGRKVLEHCKDTHKQYKDPCDKIFFSTKCMYDFNPDGFMYP